MLISRTRFAIFSMSVSIAALEVEVENMRKLSLLIIEDRAGFMSAREADCVIGFQAASQSEWI